MSEPVPTFKARTEVQVLRDGYTQAVTFDLPAEIRENLLAHTVEAETTLKLKEANHG